MPMRLRMSSRRLRGEAAMTRHITIFTDDPDKGGVAQYNHRVALALAAAGFRISMVQTESQHARVTAQAAQGISHRWIPYDTSKEFVRTITDTAFAETAFEDLNPDLVYFSDCCPVSNIAAKQAAIRRGIPFVPIVHFVAPYLAQRFASCLPVVAKQFAAAHGVIAVSSENLDLLEKLFGLAAGKGRVIFNGVAPEFFAPRSIGTRKEMRARLGLAESTVVSLTTARLSAVKLHLLQISAMEYLKSQMPNARLVCVWVGDGELRPMLEAEIVRKGLQENFLLVGSQQDVTPWYDMADIFTLTSESEGMPLSIMEAMAKELPVVATAVSGIPEELGRDGVLLVDPTKDAGLAGLQLAQTWMAWSKKPGLREGVGRRCRQRAEQLFKEETMMRNTQALLEAALAGVGSLATPAA
jgi:glycosyltransferase involved in cell wall biosynthesis